MLNNLATSLFEHNRIKTTLPKSKELVRLADRLVTLTKKSTPQAWTLVSAHIKKKKVIQRMFEELPVRFKDRQGGYTRILRLGPRSSDAAPMAIVELVQ
jgi:large subunit ribosomal protein L17